ncbi:MAG: metal-dependent hydrolase [bacterium]|nr:metal-dependent hydrolase [bacterium]
MPTIITHALVGITVAQVAPQRSRRSALLFAALFVAVAPDLDVVAFNLGIPYSHPWGHRGMAHSIFAGIVLATAMACIPQLYKPKPGWRDRAGVFAVLATAAVSHGMLDALTNGGKGIGLLLPFSAERFFFPTQPIQVSAIGLYSFLHSDFNSVLLSEAMWVWLPLLGLTLIHQAIRLAAKKHGSRSE